MNNWKGESSNGSIYTRNNTGKGQLQIKLFSLILFSCIAGKQRVESETMADVVMASDSCNVWIIGKNSQVVVQYTLKIQVKVNGR